MFVAMTRQVAPTKAWLVLSLRDLQELTRARNNGGPVRKQTQAKLERLAQSKPNDSRLGSDGFAIAVSIAEATDLAQFGRTGRMTPVAEIVLTRIRRKASPIKKAQAKSQVRRSPTLQERKSPARKKLDRAVRKAQTDPAKKRADALGELNGSSSSVRAVSGGGFETSRRRH